MKGTFVINANQGLKMSLTNQGDSFAKVLNFGKA